MGTIFDLVWLLHWLRSFIDSFDDLYRYSYLAYFSSMDVASLDSGHNSRYWYTQVSALLGSIGISLDRLPLFQFFLDAPTHLLPPQWELNEHVRLDIYRQYVITT